MHPLARILLTLAAAAQDTSDARTQGDERTIEVGETVSGVLSPDDPILAGRGPSQCFVLFADQGPVTITLESYDFDAFLRAEDSAGALLAEDDDGGVETNARLTLSALAEGSCWIIASSKRGGGEFELTARAGDVPRPSGAALLDAGIEYRSTAAERALARGDRLECARHRILEGNLRFTRSQFPQAEMAYESSLAIYRELRDRVGEVRALANLGVVYSSLGEYAKARVHHEQQLALSRELGDRAGEANALGNLGNVYLSVGDYAKAREHHEQHLALSRELGDRKGEAMARAGLGNVHSSLGDYTRAHKHFEEQLALARELGDLSAVAEALENLGKVFSALDDYAGARKHFEEQLSVARVLRDRAAEVKALGNLGLICRALGENGKAREYYEYWLALAREVGDRAAEAEASRLLESLPGRLRPSVLSDNTVILEEDLSQQRLTVLLKGLADNAKESESLIEEILGGLPTDAKAGDLRSELSGLGEFSQDVTAQFLRFAGEGARDTAIADGFSSAGRWKGRRLLHGIAEHRAGARSAEAIRLRRERREALASRQAILERVSKAIHDEKPVEEVEALREEARARLEEAEGLAERLREVSPRDAALDMPLGASPEEVRSGVLGQKDLLVEYADGEEGLYAYVLGVEGIEFLDLGTREEVGVELEAFLSGIRSGVGLAGAGELQRTGRALFDRLLAPALAGCEEPVERLVIVPNTALAALPFEALVVESTSAEPSSVGELTFVLDRYEVTYGPSSPVLALLASMGPREVGGKVLLLADPRYASEPEDEPADAAAIALLGGGAPRAMPDPKTLGRLPKTRDEALAVAELLTGDEDAEAALGLLRLRQERSGSLASERFDLHLGTAASRERLAGDLRGYAVLHLACHGFVDPEFPQRTGLALAFAEKDEGWFTIGEALELDLDANLVVLSACETARGERVAGEGIESLARAFLHSGARGVVASLWQVHDWAAEETMQSFYRGTLQQGLPPARALREAKLALRRSSALRGLGVPVAPGEAPPVLESSHPYFWAPFIHIGLAR